MKRFAFLFFCVLSFDSWSMFQTDEAISPYLNLHELSYKKEVTTPEGVKVEMVIPLVERFDSEVNREEALRKCKYLKAEDLKKDWGTSFDDHEAFEQGYRGWINESRWVEIDTEVVGVRKHKRQILQICLNEIINGQATGLLFTTYTRPPTKHFSRHTTKIHGVTWKDVKNAPDFADIAEQVRDFIGGSLVIAHNAAFDIRMLFQEYEHLQINPFTINYKCTLQMLKKDERRDENKVAISPVKSWRMQYISPEEREEIIAEEELENKEKKQKKKNRKKRQKPLKTIKKKNPGGLGHFIKTLELDAENIKGILNLRSPKKKARAEQSCAQPNRNYAHHDAEFDAMAGAVLTMSFWQKELEKNIRGSLSQASASSTPNSLISELMAPPENLDLSDLEEEEDILL